MPTTLHLVRHAQGYHNLSTANENIHDPLLTPLGKQQCAELYATFPHHDKLTHLVASPMRRTLYTCLLSFAPPSSSPSSSANGAPPAGTRSALLPVIALPEVQEVSDLPCDVGSPAAELEAEFNAGGDAGTVDFSRLDPGWTDKSVASGSRWRPVVSALEDRAKDARVWLRELGDGFERDMGLDAHIVVVTHGGFLHFLTEDWEGMANGESTGWHNTELRSYHFVPATDTDANPAALLVETEASISRRRGDGRQQGTDSAADASRPLSATERRELASVVKDRVALDLKSLDSHRELLKQLKERGEVTGEGA